MTVRCSDPRSLVNNVLKVVTENSKQDTDKSNVRFAAQDEQIEPITSLTDSGDKRPEDLSPEAHEQIRNLAMTLQKSRLQENRMSNFAYEPVSMPASRVSRMMSSMFEFTDSLRYPQETVILQEVLVVRYVDNMAHYRALYTHLR